MSASTIVRPVWVSAQYAAVTLGITHADVYRLVGEGQLTGQRVTGGRREVSAASLTAYAAAQNGEQS